MNISEKAFKDLTMAKSEPRNEAQICDLVGAFLAKRQGEKVDKKEEVDTVIRDKKAVEAIYHAGKTRFAVEHTRIESFKNQIGLGKSFQQLLEPLGDELQGKVPGTFFLTVQVDVSNDRGN